MSSTMYTQCKESDCHTNCQHSSSVSQSLDEMEFDRGIWSAAMYGEIDKIKKCLDKNINVNTTDPYGFTALHYAARNGQLEACKFLVEQGANVNVQTKELKATPLHRAVSVGHQPIVEYLLSKGADLSIRDADGKLALDRANESNRTAISNLLREKGAT